MVIINNFSVQYPEQDQDFCDKCGEKTITACQECGTNIHGYHHVSGVFTGESKVPPSYCHNCGKPYPWTIETIDAVSEFIR